MMFFFSKFPIPPLAARAFNDYYIPFIAISTPLPGSPCFQWLLHSFYRNFHPPLLATHAFNDFLLITISPPQPMLSMIITFLLSKFPPPPPRATHAFNDYYIPFIKISPPPCPGNPCFQWLLHSFYQKFSNPPLATHAFNDYYIPFIKISPPLPGQPVLSMITTFLLSQFPPPPLVGNPCFQWFSSYHNFHPFYQNFTPPPRAARAFNDYYIPFIAISTPLVGNPCFQWFSSYHNFPPQPMLSMIITFLLSKFHPPCPGNPCFQWFLHSFYQNFSPLATHVFNDSGSSTTSLCTTKCYSSTTLYYKMLLQYYSVLQSATPNPSFRIQVSDS